MRSACSVLRSGAGQRQPARLRGPARATGRPVHRQQAWATPDPRPVCAPRAQRFPHSPSAGRTMATPAPAGSPHHHRVRVLSGMEPGHMRSPPGSCVDGQSHDRPRERPWGLRRPSPVPSHASGSGGCRATALAGAARRHGRPVAEDHGAVLCHIPGAGVRASPRAGSASRWRLPALCRVILRARRQLGSAPFSAPVGNVRYRPAGVAGLNTASRVAWGPGGPRSGQERTRCVRAGTDRLEIPKKDDEVPEHGSCAVSSAALNIDHICLLPTVWRGQMWQFSSTVPNS
jgi:hypothetical protein